MIPNSFLPLARGRARAAPLLAGLIAALVLAVGAPAGAQEPIACGALYRVQPGDTLHSIATRAYGEGDYLAIFEANRDALPSVTRIEVGDRLLVPCRDGSGPQTRAAALRSAEATPGEPGSGLANPAAAASSDSDGTAALATIPAGREIRLLTGLDFAPFVDPSRPDGGLVTELVRLALDSGAPGRRLSISVGTDWTKHLDALARGKFDLGFPWYRPDCARAARLSASMRRRCEDFVFSAPLFEVRLAWYARDGDALAGASDPAALRGRRLCRPSTYFTFDLRQAGLMTAETTLVFPPTAEECFVLLRAGVVDAVSLARGVADTEISRLGLDGLVAEIPALGSVQTLHAIAPKSSAEARAFLAALDSGLAEIRDSGRWFEVVARHLGPYGVTLR